MQVHLNQDTIVSISTGLSNSGISIIRISGDHALSIVDKVYKSKSNNKILSSEKSHTIHYGFIVYEDEVIDEVMVSIFKAPATYTREDVVEINCHGGIIVTKKILDIIVQCGARISEPGEFTKRAFLNGRIDLSQAEAVMDIINAKNDMSLKNSMNHLRGGLKDIIKNARDIIIRDIAFIEAALDDPENMTLEGFNEQLLSNVNYIINTIKKLIADTFNGKIIKEGIKTVIVGKPNAGKSSLLNLLVGEERAIVTDIAGTTRDTLEENINMNGISLNLIDTAGIRDTSDIIEKIGVDKAKKFIGKGDLILYVVDSSEELDHNDYEIIELIKDKKVIILLNKADLNQKISVEQIKLLIDKNILLFSAKERNGLENLYNLIKEMFYKGIINMDEDIYITNERHKQSLQSALNSLLLVKKSIESHMPEDFFSIDLMGAYEYLGNILGESIGEDLINVIFSEFCMGK